MLLLIQSTLVNALVGVLPRRGPAKVSDRAGWTDQICFYQVILSASYYSQPA